MSILSFSFDSLFILSLLISFVKNFFHFLLNFFFEAMYCCLSQQIIFYHILSIMSTTFLSFLLRSVDTSLSVAATYLRYHVLSGMSITFFWFFQKIKTASIVLIFSLLFSLIDNLSLVCKKAFLPTDKALLFAQLLEIHDFPSSPGWLEVHRHPAGLFLAQFSHLGFHDAIHPLTQIQYTRSVGGDNTGLIRFLFDDIAKDFSLSCHIESGRRLIQ